MTDICEHEWKYDNLLGCDMCQKCRILKAYVSVQKLVDDAVTAERERCAKLCESQNPCCSQPYDEWHGVCHMSDAALIRKS